MAYKQDKNNGKRELNKMPTKVKEKWQDFAEPIFISKEKALEILNSEPIKAKPSEAAIKVADEFLRSSKAEREEFIKKFMESRKNAR
ncbi:hypothetical protein QS257_14895 [Terrilactibacillus sp. S3-3]|nr:hypothetical protein QS257_14895 [Terrilactibacillus sp. S3-3]